LGVAAVLYTKKKMADEHKVLTRCGHCICSILCAKQMPLMVKGLFTLILFE